MTDDLFDSPSGNYVDAYGIPRSANGRYRLPDPSTAAAGSVRTWTRATTFAGAMEDTYLLNLWQTRMAMIGLTRRADLYALAAATPVDNRKALNEIATKAQEVAGSKARATLGTAIHAFCDQVDQGLDLTCPEAYRATVLGYAKLVADYGLEMVERERVIIVPQYGVAGMFDRIWRLTRPLRFRIGDQVIDLPAGELVMGDIKSGDDVEEFAAGSIGIQVALYAHGSAMWKHGTTALGSAAYDPMPAVNRRVALVAHVPPPDAEGNQPPARLLPLDIQKGWAAVELAHQVRGWRKTKDLFGSVVLPQEGGDQADESDIQAEIQDLERLAVSAPDGVHEEILERITTLEQAPVCGAVDEITSAVCAIRNPDHLTHRSERGVRWPRTDLPAGQNCIQCQRPVTSGRIQHARGCPEVVRRRVTQTTGLPVGQPLPSGAQDAIGRLEPGYGVTDAGSIPPEMLTEWSDDDDPFADALAEPELDPLMEAVRTASSPGQLSATRKAAMAAGTWTDAHLKAGMARLEYLKNNPQ